MGQYLIKGILVVLGVFFISCSNIDVKRDELLSPYPIFDDVWQGQKTISVVKQKKDIND
ncbi:MAG: hypothetical protein ABGW74_05620 [Campylobacterales bacterium]